MKSSTRILVAFLLSLGFSIFELVGGILTGSAAIASDAFHAFGDSLSTGLAFVLERKSLRLAQAKDKRGFLRYSTLGAFITTAILMAGAILIVESGIERLVEPRPVDSEGMIWLAVAGIAFSVAATWVTRDTRHRGHEHHHSLNQRAVSLHMLQDSLNWVIVLAGALLMRFTDVSVLDPLMSIAVAVFILVSAVRNLLGVMNELLDSVV